MPLIPGKVCVSAQSFIRSTRRLMTFTSYWEPVVPAETYAQMKIRANAAHDEISALWKEIADDSFNFVGVNLIQQSATDYLDAFSSGAAVPGELTTSTTNEFAEPDILALIIQKRTGQPGRWNRGRMFIPGLSEDLQTGGLVLGGAEGIAAQNLADYFGADREWGTSTMHARHWVRFGTDDLVVITHCRAMSEVKTLRSRDIQGANIPVAIA